MRKLLNCIVAVSTLMLTACSGSKLGYTVKNESVKMNVTQVKDIINYTSLNTQQIPSFAQRIEQQKSIKPNFGFGENEAFLGAPLAARIVSFATDGIKNMIENDKKKFTAKYSFALTNLYFYDQLSTENAFDPLGMQFNGFTIVRTFKNQNNETDTALTAEFVLDTNNPYEIINDAVFRLKLKKLDLRYAKAKVQQHKQHLNVDFEIIFSSSYVNEQGVLFDNVTLGKFYLFLREAPLNKDEPSYTAYYEKLKNKSLDGKSFIVPRSFGYYIANNNVRAKCYNQGAYSIVVNVKESSKNNFVNKVIVNNSNFIINSAGNQLNKVIQ